MGRSANSSTYRGLDWAMHNPGLLRREELIARFLLRRPLLDELVRQLRLQPQGAALRHLLCIGQRGMGKTTLLLRLFYFVEDDPELRLLWQPVILAEEQYQIGDLADLFLAVLRQLAETTEQMGLSRRADELLDQDLPAEALTQEALAEITRFCKRSRRRLVIFVDNLNLILGQLKEQEAHRLRRILMTEGNILVVGAAATYFTEVSDYNQPFYEFFRIFRLEGLDDGEFERFLQLLAEHNRDQSVLEGLERHPDRVRNLRRLTGGNPRIALFLYRLIAETPDGEIRGDLERLLDEVTPFYKHRMESLPPQQRRIFDAIAQHWHPVEAGELTHLLRLPSNAISAQIRRLIEEGYVEEAGGSGKQKLYQVAERMYNIYYLMRFSRPGRKRLQWLALFLRAFYEQDYLLHLADSWIDRWRQQPAPGEAQRERVHTLSYIAQALDKDDDRVSLMREKVIPYGKSQGLSTEELDGLIKEVYFASVADKSREFLSSLRTASIAHYEGQLAQADAALERAASLVPQVHAAWTWLSLNFTWLGKDDQALDAARNATSLEPGTKGKSARKLRAVDWTQLGTAYLRKNEPVKAEEALRKAAKLDPSEKLIWNNLGAACAQQGKFEEAKKALLRAVKLAPDDAAILTNLAGVYEQQGLNQQSYKTLQEVLRIDPAHAKAWENLSIVHWKEGQIEKARLACEKAVELDAELAVAWGMLGAIYAEYDRLDDALKESRKATELDPSLAWVWSNLAGLLSRAGQPQDAMSAVRKALELNPAAANSWSNLGAILVSMDKPDEAMEAMAKAVELDPQAADAWANLGALRLQGGELEQARVALEQALAIKPMNAVAAQNLSSVYLKLGQPERAQAVAEQGLRAAPNVAALWHNLGAAFGRLARPDEALKAFERSAMLDPGVARVWHNIGGIRLVQGDLDGARKALEKSVELEDSLWEGWLNLGTVYWEQGLAEQALAATRRTTTLNPMFVLGWMNLGGMYQARRQVAAAIAAYEKAAEIDPSIIAVWDDLGQLYLAIGNLEQAWAAYVKALALDPASITARSNLGLIYLMENKVEMAASELEQVVSAAPKSGAVRQNLGLAYLALGKPQEALAQFEKAVEIQPGQWILLWNLASTYDLVGQPDRALATVEQARQVIPRDANAWVRLGRWYLGRGLLGQALDVFTRLLELAPGHAAGWHNNIGHITMQQGELARAREALGQGLALDDRLADAWQNLFYLHLLQDEPGPAQEALDRLLALEPQRDTVALWMNVGELAARQQRHSQALAIFERATSHHPQDPVLWSRLAWLELALHPEALDAADRAIHRALALAPDEPWTLLIHALILTARRRWTEALTAVDVALRHVDTIFLEQAQAYLLGAIIQIAAQVDACQLAELVDRHVHLQLNERWLPLRAALDVLSGSGPERLLRLSLEVRPVAEDLLARIRAVREVADQAPDRALLKSGVPGQ